MPRLLKFKLNRECREIAVNPEKVLYVCPYETGASALHFSKDCFVRVQGSLDDVMKKLESALCDGPEAALPEAPGPERLQGSGLQGSGLNVN